MKTTFKQLGTVHTTSKRYASYSEYLQKEQELNKKASNAITKGVLIVMFSPFINYLVASRQTF